MQVKKKEAMKEYLCFSVGYCEAQTIARGAVKVGYCAGVYGWNCDIFAAPGLAVAICTGYRPFGYSSKATREIVKDYEARAALIPPGNTYEDYRNEMSSLFYAMLMKLYYAWRKETENK